MITNPDYEPIFNNIISVNEWANKIKEDQEIREPKLDRHTHQNFNAVADVMIRESKATILPQMLANNKIRDMLILENIIEQEEDQNRQLAAKIEPKLDVYLRDKDDDLDTNCSHPRLKRHQKKPLLIASENKKPKERLNLCQEN